MSKYFPLVITKHSASSFPCGKKIPKTSELLTARTRERGENQVFFSASFLMFNFFPTKENPAFSYNISYPE
jgi:hypothetical protein